MVRATARATWLEIVGLVAAFLLVLVRVVFVVASGHNSRDERPRETELPARQPYTATVRADEAMFDLRFNPKMRYLVIVASLGPAERSYEIECSSQPVRTIRFPPADRVTLFGGRPFGATVSTLRPRDKEFAERCVIPASFSAMSKAKPLAARAESRRLGGSREFSIHVTDGSLDDPAQYTTIHANVVAEGRQVRVYLDDQQSAASLAGGLVQEIVDLFDNELVPRFGAMLGTYRDVDHDGRFAVLLTPWLGRLQGGRTSVGGFVRGSDFQSCLGLPFSNRCDMMYVNSQTLPGPRLRTLLIHEYTHAVCFSQRMGDSLTRPRFADEEDWLNEAIAHSAESLFHAGWSNLDYRMARFLNDPGAFPLVVPDYYRAGLCFHGCRGATYLFLRYCLEQFGPETLTRLINNPARGTHNIELATGCPFEELFRGWTLSLAGSACLAAAPHGPQTESAIAPDADLKHATPALAPLDSCGTLGEWGLAGPRRIAWNGDAGPRTLTLKGTSAEYLEVAAGGSAGLRTTASEGVARLANASDHRAARRRCARIELAVEAP